MLGKKQIFLARNSNLNTAIGQLLVQRSRLVKFVLILLLGVSTTGCASLDRGMGNLSNAFSSADPVTGKREITLTSEKQEIKKAEAIENQFFAAAQKNHVRVDAELPEWPRVKRVFNRLEKVVHRRHLPWAVHLIEDKKFNAFAVGGGKVFVFTGILRDPNGVQNDDELAAVLAHEMAHIAARHVTEGQDQMRIAALADHNTANKQYHAAHTTLQEEEADKYSTVYSALAGYDPSAAAGMWQRMHKVRGSYSGNLLYDHPLNEDRAKNILRYANAARAYYIPGQINPNYETLRLNNAVYHHEIQKNPAVGKGGGFLSLLDTVASAYSEDLKTKTEINQREIEALNRQRAAATAIGVLNLKIAKTTTGGKGLFGEIQNRRSQANTRLVLRLRYLSANNAVITSEDIPIKPLAPLEKRAIGIALKNYVYSSVQLYPVYADFEEPQ